jgi:hypothetical protein
MPAGEVATMEYGTTTGTRYGAIGARLVLTLVGAAGMIVGAFLTWLAPSKGTDLDISALWRTSFDTTTTFVSTVGALSILLGLIAIVGVAFGSGWLTRLAGALGIVTVVLFAIEVFRAPGAHTVGDLGVGVWVVLAGSVVVLIAGFIGMVSAPATSAPQTTVVNED